MSRLPVYRMDRGEIKRRFSALLTRNRAEMNARHRKTLAVILSASIPRSLPFRDIESLLRGIGCSIEEGDGSRVSFIFGEHSWTTHRPHPGKEARDYHIKRVRVFLEKIGHEP